MKCFFIFFQKQNIVSNIAFKKFNLTFLGYYEDTSPDTTDNSLNSIHAAKASK